MVGLQQDHSSSYTSFQHTDRFGRKELEEGGVTGPFQAAPSPDTVVAPLMTVPKRPDSRRVVYDASYGPCSLNENTPRDCYLGATPDYDFHSVDQFEELVVTAGPAPLLWKRVLASFVCPATPDYNFHSVDQFEELVVTADQEKPRIPGHLHAPQGGYCREHNMRLQSRVAAAAFWSAYWRTHVPNARDLYAPAPRPPEDSRAPEERTEERGNTLRLLSSSAPPTAGYMKCSFVWRGLNSQQFAKFSNFILSSTTSVRYQC